MSGNRLLAVCAFCIALLPCFGCGGGPSPADVEMVRMTQTDGGWNVAVTVRHQDSGWDHYADRWVITDERGRELARRVLRHPHVEQQPFTRSLEGVTFPPGTEKVVVRAHCSVHGDVGRAVTVDLSLDRGPGFIIERPAREGSR